MLELEMLGAGAQKGIIIAPATKLLTDLAIPQLAVVLHQRLEDLVNLHGSEREADVDDREGAEVSAVR